jgi:WD40 repeat protein
MTKTGISWRVGLLLFLATIFVRCSAPETALKVKEIVLPTNSPTVVTEQVTISSSGMQKQKEYTATPDPSPISNPTFTPKPTETITEIRKCSGGGRIALPSKGFNISGTLFYQTRDSPGIFMFGGSPLSHHKLPISDKEEVFSIGFSPDGKWFAYAPVITNTSSKIAVYTPLIVILSSSGEKIELPLDFQGKEGDPGSGEYLTGISSPSYWINSNLLFTTLNYDYHDLYTPSLGIPILLDAFQGSWMEKPIEKLKDRFEYQYLSFSPDMMRALYGAKNGIVLRDLEKDDILWSDPEYPNDQFALFRWSPDSYLVAVTNLLTLPEKRSLFFLSRNGEKREDILPFLPSGNYRVYDIGWSRDSRFLALIVDYEEQDDQIYIYDTKLSHFTYSCPLVGFQAEPPNLLWSPDGSSIALFGLSYDSPLLVLKIKAGEIIEVAQNAVTVGWSDQFPVKWP